MQWMPSEEIPPRQRATHVHRKRNRQVRSPQQWRSVGTLPAALSLIAIILWLALLGIDGASFGNFGGFVEQPRDTSRRPFLFLLHCLPILSAEAACPLLPPAIVPNVVVKDVSTGKSFASQWAISLSFLTFTFPPGFAYPSQCANHSRFAFSLIARYTNTQSGGVGNCTRQYTNRLSWVELADGGCTYRYIKAQPVHRGLEVGGRIGGGKRTTSLISSEAPSEPIAAPNTKEMGASGAAASSSSAEEPLPEDVVVAMNVRCMFAGGVLSPLSRPSLDNPRFGFTALWFGSSLVCQGAVGPLLRIIAPLTYPLTQGSVVVVVDVEANTTDFDPPLDISAAFPIPTRIPHPFPPPTPRPPPEAFSPPFVPTFPAQRLTYRRKYPPCGIYWGEPALRHQSNVAVAAATVGGDVDAEEHSVVAEEDVAEEVDARPSPAAAFAEWVRAANSSAVSQSSSGSSGDGTFAMARSYGDGIVSSPFPFTDVESPFEGRGGLRFGGSSGGDHTRYRRVAARTSKTRRGRNGGRRKKKAKRTPPAAGATTGGATNHAEASSSSSSSSSSSLLERLRTALASERQRSFAMRSEDANAFGGGDGNGEGRGHNKKSGGEAAGRTATVEEESSSSSWASEEAARLLDGVYPNQRSALEELLGIGQWDERSGGGGRGNGARPQVIEVNPEVLISVVTKLGRKNALLQDIRREKLRRRRSRSASAAATETTPVLSDAIPAATRSSGQRQVLTAPSPIVADFQSHVFICTAACGLATGDVLATLQQFFVFNQAAMLLQYVDLIANTQREGPPKWAYSPLVLQPPIQNIIFDYFSVVNEMGEIRPLQSDATLDIVSTTADCVGGFQTGILQLTAALRLWRGYRSYLPPTTRRTENAPWDGVWPYQQEPSPSCERRMKELRACIRSGNATRKGVGKGANVPEEDTKGTAADGSSHVSPAEQRYRRRPPYVPPRSLTRLFEEQESKASWNPNATAVNGFYIDLDPGDDCASLITDDDRDDYVDWLAAFTRFAAAYRGGALLNFFVGVGAPALSVPPPDSSASAARANYSVTPNLWTSSLDKQGALSEIKWRTRIALRPVEILRDGRWVRVRGDGEESDGDSRHHGTTSEAEVAEAEASGAANGLDAGAAAKGGARASATRPNVTLFVPQAVALDSANVMRYEAKATSDERAGPSPFTSPFVSTPAAPFYTPDATSAPRSAGAAAVTLETTATTNSVPIAAEKYDAVAHFLEAIAGVRGAVGPLSCECSASYNGTSIIYRRNTTTNTSVPSSPLPLVSGKADASFEVGEPVPLWPIPPFVAVPPECVDSPRLIVGISSWIGTTLMLQEGPMTEGGGSGGGGSFVGAEELSSGAGGLHRGQRGNPFSYDPIRDSPYQWPPLRARRLPRLQYSSSSSSSTAPSPLSSLNATRDDVHVSLENQDGKDGDNHIPSSSSSPGNTFATARLDGSLPMVMPLADAPIVINFTNFFEVLREHRLCSIFIDCRDTVDPVGNKPGGYIVSRAFLGMLEDLQTLCGLPDGWDEWVETDTDTDADIGGEEVGVDSRGGITGRGPLF